PAPDLSFIKSSDSNFSGSEQPVYPNMTQPTTKGQDEVQNSYSNAENNEEDGGYFFNFDNMPPPAPMRFSDAPPASMHLNIDSPKPMSYEDMKNSSEYSDYNNPAQQSEPQPKQFSHLGKSDNPQQPKPEKKHLFGKKAKDADALKKAEEIVNSRKDVPNDGTWTCPNCGKVMPKYVGTCGCGESQPFEF
ncbi:MAG: hypothetical protein ACI4XP_06780, partial [Acutalibacteraceae bacterium]